MIDSDLAILFGVQKKTLIGLVKRNIERFPEDFMFKLSPKEQSELKSYFEDSDCYDRSSYFTMAFTEAGVIMLSCLLRTAIANQTSINIIRALILMKTKFENNLTHKTTLEHILRRLDTMEHVVDLIVCGQKNIIDLHNLHNKKIDMQINLINTTLAELRNEQTESKITPIGYKYIQEPTDEQCMSDLNEKENNHS